MENGRGTEKKKGTIKVKRRCQRGGYKRTGMVEDNSGEPEEDRVVIF